uniref:Uncharacterized protein n=1 Tax=Lactuca sativa TaxID=4236 RepID=A0A9R1WYG4_LACSA|nr:hypothetical protein LSAT_V11C800426920 [Lactuca sativa]
MDRGKVVVDGGVTVKGTSGLLPHEKLKVELDFSDSKGSLEPTTPLSLSKRDEEDEDVESEVEPEEDPDEEPEEDFEEEPGGNHVEYHVEQRYETFHMPYVEYTPTSLVNMSSRRSRRFTRVTPEEERIPIGAYVRAPGDVPKAPLIPNASHGRGQGRGRVRGRGRGAITTPIPIQSAHGSPGSHRGRSQGRGRGRTAHTITREELADEIDWAI